MTCSGFDRAPAVIYKRCETRTTASGRKRRFSGRGKCATCGGLYATRYIRGKVGIGHHKDLRQCTEQIKRQHTKAQAYWESYARFGVPNQMTTGLLNGDFAVNRVIQTVNVIESPEVQTQSVGSREFRSRTPFRVEISSHTYDPRANAYLYEFNGSQFAFNSPTVTVTTQQMIWNGWTNNITLATNSTIQTDVVWNNWTVPYVTGHSQTNLTTAYDIATEYRMAMNHRVAYTAPREDPAAYEERIRRQAEALFIRTEAERVAKEAAVAKAQMTLLSLLTPEQRNEYRARQRFHIRGSRGTLYRIQHGSSGNVRAVLTEADEGRGLHAYCAHPEMTVRGDDGKVLGYLPHEDAMIAQMLALESDEAAFLAVANRHW